MLRTAIVTLVETKLDEVSPFDDGEVVEDDLIDNSLDEATREILLKVPRHVITETDISQTGASHSSDGTGYLKRPKDFLRFLGLKCSDWSNTVTELLEEKDPKAQQQKYSYIRGGDQKPVVVSEYHSNIIGKIIKYYSGAGTHTVISASYVPETVAEDLQDGGTVVGGLNEGLDLTDVLAWQVAGNILIIKGHPEKAKAAYAKVEDFIKDHSL